MGFGPLYGMFWPGMFGGLIRGYEAVPAGHGDAGAGLVGDAAGNEGTLAGDGGA